MKVKSGLSQRGYGFLTCDYALVRVRADTAPTIECQVQACHPPEALNEAHALFHLGQVHVPFLPHCSV